MFLVDTNCLMEVARSRAHAADVTRFLSDVPALNLHVALYSVHSIGLLVPRHNMPGQYGPFVSQIGIGTRIGVTSVPLPQLGLVDDACTSHNLDFDDAYQYVAAELNGLTVVSYDADFDRTPRGRLEPLAALSQYRASQRQNP